MQFTPYWPGRQVLLQLEHRGENIFEIGPLMRSSEQHLKKHEHNSTTNTLPSVVCKCPTHSYEVSQDLLDAMEARVAQALPGDNVTDAVETVAAVVLAVFAISTVGAAHLAPIAHKRNVLITVIVTAGGKRYYGGY